MSDDDPNAIGPWSDGHKPERLFLHRTSGEGEPRAVAIQNPNSVQVWLDDPGLWVSARHRWEADALILRLYPPRRPSVVRESTISGVVMALAVAVEVAVKHRLPGVAREISAAGESLVARIRSQPPEGT